MSSDTDHLVPSSTVADAAALGLPALAGLVADAQGGIVIVDGDRRYVYANPAACQMLGRSLNQLRDRDFLDSFSVREHANGLARFAAELGHGSETFSCVLPGSDGAEREVVCSTFTIDIAGRPHGVVVLWDLTRHRADARTASALAQTAAQLVRTGTTSEILTSIARHAVEGSRALACGISVMDDQHVIVARGGFGGRDSAFGNANPAWVALSEAPVDQVIETMTAGSIVLGGIPGKPVVVSAARSAWSTHPVMRGFAANLESLDWQSVVCAPLSWQDRVFGLFSVFLPSGMAGPSEVELAHITALADQAAVAVMNARFASDAGTTAALLERGRLARDLHDSVSQGLFSMTMHARAAQLSMAKAGVDENEPLGRSITQLSDLTRGALAEMRALIFELRPGALAEEGLIGALRKQAAALAAREGLIVMVSGPGKPLHLDAGVEEHLYRIVLEALHNVVKHARATRATVTITTETDALRAVVRDDGVGFDADLKHPGRLGMDTMAQRAEAMAARLIVTSESGAGTVVTVTLANERARSA